MTTNARAVELLEESIGKANNKLKREIMFSLLLRLGINECYRCKQPMAAFDFSIEHKVSWQKSYTPKETFYDLSNIDFSHFGCNSAAANRERRVHGIDGAVDGCNCYVCRKAANKIKNKYKIEWPTIEYLEQRIVEVGREALGRELGVSGNAIKFHIRATKHT